jgi:hypothetical protein
VEISGKIKIKYKPGTHILEGGEYVISIDVKQSDQRCLHPLEKITYIISRQKIK